MPTTQHLPSAAAAAAALVFIGLAALDSSAAVVVISRESSISVNGVGQDTPFSDDRTFSGAGQFNDSITLEEGSPPNSAFARGTASQNTTVSFGAGGNGPITGAGSLTADAFAQLADDPQSGNNVSADSNLDIRFQVTGNAEPFSISGQFEILDLFPGATIVLTDTEAEIQNATRFIITNDSQVLTETTFDSGEISLAPSTYLLAFHAAAGSSGTGPGGVEPFGQHSEMFNLDFTIGQAVTPPPPTVIPLPAGVWAGMIGLTAAAGAGRRARG